MANVKSNININVKTTGAQRSAKDVAAVSSAINRLGAQSTQATGASNTLGKAQTRLGQASASSGRQFSSQAAGLGGLVGAYAGAAATIFALQQAFSALNRAAQVENIIRGTQTLAAQVGESGNKIIKSIQEITDSQLTLGEAAEKANLALASGFSTKQIEGLAFVANQASRALGRNLGDAFERVVRGTAKLEPELLDELGIFTRLDPAVRKYAKELNKSIGELTEFERRQAFVNAVIEEGTRKFSAIDTSAPSAQKSLEKLSTVVVDIGTKVGGLLANALAPLADFFSKDITGALSIFGIIAGQVTRVAFRELSGAADGVTARLSNFKAGLIESGSQSDAARFSLSALNSTMASQSQVTAIGTKKQREAADSLFELGKQGKLSASDLESFNKVATQQLALQTKNADGARERIATLQATGVTTATARNKLATYNATLATSTAAQTQLTNSLALTNTAISAVATSAARTSKSITILTGVIKLATVAVRILSSVLSSVFIIAALLPVIEKVIGIFPRLEAKINDIKNAFLDAKEAQKAYSDTIRSLTNDAGIKNITKDFVSLGRSARDAAATQQEVLQFLTKIGKVEFPALTSLSSQLRGVSTASVDVRTEIAVVQGALGGLTIAAAGLAAGVGAIFAPAITAFSAIGIAIVGTAVALDGLVGKLTDYESKFAGLLEGLFAFFGVGSSTISTVEDQLESVNTKIQQLEGELANAKTMDEYLGIRQFISSLESTLPLIKDGSIALRQFASEMSRATGLNIDKVFENLSIDKDGFVSINSVVIALRNAEGQIKSLTGPSKDLIETFSGFSTVFAGASSDLTNFDVSSQDLIKTIEALSSAEVNLKNKLKDVSGQVLLLKREEQTAIAALESIMSRPRSRADKEQLQNIIDRITELQEERALLESFSEATERRLVLDQIVLDNLKSIGDELSKQEKTYENILKSLSSEIAAFEDIKLQGVFDIDSLSVAESAFGVAANKIKNLSSEINADMGNITEDFDRLFGPSSTFSDPFDKSTESVTEFFARAKDSIAGAEQLAERIRLSGEATKNLDTAAKGVLGTFILQVKALEDLRREVARTVRDFQLDALRTAINSEISLMQAVRTNRQATASLAKEERNLALETLDANMRTVQERSNFLIDALNTDKELLNIQESMLDAQLQIAQAKIEASQIELDNAKNLLELGNKGLQDSKISKDLKEFFSIITDVTGAGLDVANVQQEAEKISIEIASLDKLAALDTQRFAIEREVIAERADQASLQNSLELARIKIDSSARVDDLKERLLQVEEEQRIVELRGELQKAELAALVEDRKFQLEALNKRVEEANKLILGMQDFVSQYITSNNNFINQFDATTQRLINQLVAAISGTTPIAGAGAPSVVDPQAATTAAGAAAQGGITQGPDDNSRGTVTNNIENVTIQGLSGSSNNNLVDAIALTIKNRESSNNYRETNFEWDNYINSGGREGSSATGAYGFTKGTWGNLTKQLGMGTEYTFAKDAPASIQDAIAKYYIEDILKRSGGNIASVPTEWYTGNLEGTMTQRQLDTNRGMDSATYNAGWMRDFKKIDDTLIRTTGTLGDAANALEDSANTQAATQAALAQLERDRLAGTQSSINRQITLEEERGNAALSAAEAAAAGQAGQLDNESKLVDAREAAANAQQQADAAANKNRERAVQLEEKLARVRLAQATFEGLSRFGNLLQSVTAGRAEERQLRAQETYNASLAVHEEKLDRVKDARKKESEAVLESLDIIRDRRDLERSMMDSIAAGMDGYSDYFKLQKEYLDNIKETSASTDSLKLVQRDRLLTEQDAYLAQIDLEFSTSALADANSSLEKAQNSVINKLGTMISKLGDAGQKLISFTTFVQGLAAAAGQGVGAGSILGNLGQLFGFNLKDILKSFLAPLDLLGTTLSGTAKATGAAATGIAEGAAAAQTSLGGVGKVLQGIGSVISSAFIGAGVANLIEEADPMKATVLGAIGGVLGTWAGVSIAAAISGTAFGASFGAVLGPLGAILGGLLGGFVAKFFTKTKSSGAVVDLASGATSAAGEQGGALTAVVKYADSLNEVLEDIIGTSNRASSFRADFASKGKKIKRQDISVNVDGQTITKGVDFNNAEDVSKKTFELLIQGFKSSLNSFFGPIGAALGAALGGFGTGVLSLVKSTNNDILTAINRLDFQDEIEKNLEKLSFAASFRDIVKNIESQIQSGYMTLEQEIESIASSTSANLNQITNGLLKDFQDLISRTIDVFGAGSSQLAEIEQYGSRLILSYAGLALSANGVVSIIERESETMNNLALVFASIEGETRGFRDALIELGTSASEADRIIETGISLKIAKIGKEFDQAIDKALNLSRRIDNEIYDSLEEVFKAQRALVQDAQLVQSRVAGTFGIVAKTEELIFRQRMRLLSESSDEQLKAIRILTSVTSEFADATTQAAAQAEIASRTLLGLFNTSEIQKAARRSESRLSFNFASVGLATGGVVPGSGPQQNKDSVPAMLMPGEFVLNKDSAKKIGYDTLYSLNSGDFKQMAAGGAVQTSLVGSTLKTTATPSSTRSAFAEYESDANASFISLAEAANILTDANEELFAQYVDIFKSINSNLIPAFEFAQDRLAEGNILLARAAFEYTTGVRDSVSVTDAYNKIIAETRTQEILRQTGLVASIDEIDNFVEASDKFFLAIQSPQDFLVEQAGLYKKLYSATSELNKLLGQGAISTDQYNSSISALNNAYTASIDLVREYNSFFIDLNDSLDTTGALATVRDLVETYVVSIDKISYAVEDGVIATTEAYKKEIQLNTLYNQKRIELVKNSTEEQLKVLRDAATNAEDYGGGIGTIVDFTYQAGAAAELLTRQLQAASEGFASFETSLVDFYNSTLQASVGFGSRLTKSVESIFLEAGIVFDDSLSEFFGSVGTFAVQAQQGLVGLGDLETALGQLNYQLMASESIDIETYRIGVSILQNSFVDFVSTFQDMKDGLDSAKDAMESFRSSLSSSFESAVRDISRLLQGMVSTYRSNFENLRNLFNSSVTDQANAEEELYNTLFDAQKAFESAGGNLSQHVARINDIVQGLDPKYTGYSGLDQYLVDLRLDIEAGTAAIGSIDTSIPLSELRSNLEDQIQKLAMLQTLPDSADKFVKISRALSTITDLESQINGTTNTTDKLKEAALALVDVEKELNLNNTIQGLTNVDLTLTEIQDDLLARAVAARSAYNDANIVLDGYNSALAQNTVYTNGLAEASLDAGQKIQLFTNRLTDVSSEFLNVQAAINSVTAEGLSEALNNIVFSQDAYNIAVEPFSDSARVLTELTNSIADYRNIVDAKNAYEALYGALDTVSNTLPIAEFQELSTELQFLQTNLLAVAKNIDPTLTSLDTLDNVFKMFITDAISLLETPIQLDIVEPTLNTGLQQYTLGTTSTNNNQVQFGTSATNSILQAILTQGLGVRSPGYLYYTNLYLEDIRSILSNLLTVSGGVVPALNNIAAPVSSSSTTTASSSSTMYAGPNFSNLSGLTGQLFSVTEPIAKPTDYFYIVVPQIIKFDQLIEIVKAQITIYDLVTIVKAPQTIDTWVTINTRATDIDEWLNIGKRITDFDEWVTIRRVVHTIDTWVIIAKRNTGIDEWLDIIKRFTDFDEWLDIVIIDTELTDWVNIIKQDHDYRTWFNQPTPLPTNYLKWFIPTPEKTSWSMWFSAPTLMETGFADWFSWPPSAKWETSAYDWFDIARREIRYIDFFDVREKIDINTFVASIPVTAETFFNINTIATDFYQWFYITPIASLDYYDFFTAVVPVETSSADWFLLDKPIDLVPSDLYVVTEPIQLSPYQLFTPTVETITASALYKLEGTLIANPNELIRINELAKIVISYVDIFELGTTKLEITDMFENYSVNGGFDFVKATVDIGDIFDLEAFNANGFATKLKIDPSDLFEEVDNNWWVPSEGVGIEPDVFFAPLTGVNPFDFFFPDPLLRTTNFYEWFDAPELIDIANIFEVFQPIPLDLLNVFDLSNTREALAPSQVFTLSPNPTSVQASQVFSIGAKYRLQGNEILEFIPYEVLASEFIDFSYLRSNPYQANAIDLFTLVGTVPINLFNYLEIIGKASFAAIDVINVGKSTFYGDELIEIVPMNIASTSLFTITNPVALPGSSFYAISAPTALPAGTFIGVDTEKKLEYTFDDVISIMGDSVPIGLTEVFSNFDYRNGFNWVKYSLSVEDVVDISAASTLGLTDKITLSVSDIIGNYAFGDLKLADKIDIDYDSLFNPIAQKDSDFFSWFNKNMLDTSFADWFYMNESTKLDLSNLVNNSVPLDYRDVFDFSNTTKVKPTNWDQAIAFDAAIKIPVRGFDIFIIEATTYQASDLINFDKSTIDVDELITIGRKIDKTAGSLLNITTPIAIGAANLLEITSPLQVDLNQGISFKKAVVDGSAIFTPKASEMAGINFFNPTQFAISGAAFFTPVANSIDANDLFIISEKVPIDVTATFKSDFMEMVTAINTMNDDVSGFLKTIDDNIKNNPKDSAVALYDQIWDYYQNSFLKPYYDQWTSNFAKLPDIAASVAVAATMLTEIRDIVKAQYAWTIEFFQPKIITITDTLVAQWEWTTTIFEPMITTMKDTLVAQWNWTTTIFEPMITTMKDTLVAQWNWTTTIFEPMITTMKDKLIAIANSLPDPGIFKGMHGFLETIKDTLVSQWDWTKDFFEPKMNTNNELLGDIKTALGNEGLLYNIKGLLEAIDLKLYYINGGTDYLDDIEKVLRESIFLKALGDLKDINKVRYTYPGAITTNVPGYKTGGLVEGPGTGTSDSIPARLSSGEFVLTADTVSKVGPEFLNTLNSTGDVSTALSTFGIRGDTQMAHINDIEAAMLKSMGGSGTTNNSTGLKQYFFDGRPTPAPSASVAAEDTLSSSVGNYDNIFNKPDAYPQWLYGNNASSYTRGYNASVVGNAVSALIRSSTYAKGGNLSYVHKNWHRIRDYYWGSISNRPTNLSEFGYDWNDWNNSIDASTAQGNPSSLAGTYNKDDWGTLASKVWNTWGVNSSTITPEGKDLANTFGIPGYKDGGLASGGGTGTSDSMLARISDGEYIVRNSSVDSVGVDTLDYINRNGTLPSGDTNIEVNIINKGQPVDTEVEPKVTIVDGKMVIDVVLKDLRTNGPIKRSIKKIK